MVGEGRGGAESSFTGSQPALSFYCGIEDISDQVYVLFLQHFNGMPNPVFLGKIRNFQYVVY